MTSTEAHNIHFVTYRSWCAGDDAMLKGEIHDD